ncbi:hypothetical protein B9Z55_021838 [Caenorhabditis nigoni]|uniref:MRG domain-containing protein n=1 Tax=Caenorhabditis nigoni TaxID=1611254 RepID=A0A2G5TTT8_9PELO|nr:hypothetical protein B9Z55_021838 [Caenorhabditis nigoni]
MRCLLDKTIPTDYFQKDVVHRLSVICPNLAKIGLEQLLYKTEWTDAQKQATRFATQQKKRRSEDPNYVIVEFKATEHYGFVHLLRLFTKLPNLIHGSGQSGVLEYRDVIDKYRLNGHLDSSKFVFFIFNKQFYGTF